MVFFDGKTIYMTPAEFKAVGGHPEWKRYFVEAKRLPEEAELRKLRARRRRKQALRC
jgi:hypothetical protein